MKKALKITGIVVGVLVLLVIVLAVTLPFLINPNRFKDDIARAVKEKTGRELVIQGDIKLSIFPWLGVQIGPAELSNAKGFGAVPFAAINETDVHVAFWPLLHKRVEVGEVKLDGLSLDLEHDAEGRSNWQDISEHMARNAAAGKPASAEAGSGGAVDLSVAGVSVTDSQVRWTDAQKHQQYTVSDFTLKLGAFSSGKPLSLEAGFDFTGTNPALQGHADFKGTATADLEGRIYSADDATLELQAKGDKVPGGQVDASLHWQHAVANLAQGSVALNGLEADAYGLKLQMEAQGKDVTKAQNVAASGGLDFQPRLAQIFLVEEGTFADEVVDISKFQQFVVTILIVVAYTATAVQWISNHGTAQSVTSLPTISTALLTLFGISHGAYVVGKAPTSAGDPPLSIQTRNRDREDFLVQKRSAG